MEREIVADVSAIGRLRISNYHRQYFRTVGTKIQKNTKSGVFIV